MIHLTTEQPPFPWHGDIQSKRQLKHPQRPAVSVIRACRGSVPSNSMNHSPSSQMAVSFPLTVTDLKDITSMLSSRPPDPLA